MTRRLTAPTPGSKAGAVVCLVAVGLVMSACGGSSRNLSQVAVVSSSAPTMTSPQTAPTTMAGAEGVVVTDASGATFRVELAPMTSTPYVDADTFLWSAAPGQQFLRDIVTVTNPTTAPESLSAFDDLVSGHALDLEFTLSADNAATTGYSSDCGADADFPSSVCPFSFGQGVTVDLDSANHGDRSVVQFAPGASAQITVSYGPILMAVQPAMVGVYFDNGQAAAVLLPS